jgi:hypothetical protein
MGSLISSIHCQSFLRICIVNVLHFLPIFLFEEFIQAGKPRKNGTISKIISSNYVRCGHDVFNALDGKG